MAIVRRRQRGDHWGITRLQTSIRLLKLLDDKAGSRVLIVGLNSCAQTKDYKEGVWTLQAGIFPENRASLGMVEACALGLTPGPPSGRPPEDGLARRTQPAGEVESHSSKGKRTA